MCLAEDENACYYDRITTVHSAAMMSREFNQYVLV